MTRNDIFIEEIISILSRENVTRLFWRGELAFAPNNLTSHIATLILSFHPQPERMGILLVGKNSRSAATPGWFKIMSILNVSNVLLHADLFQNIPLTAADRLAHSEGVSSWQNYFCIYQKYPEHILRLYTLDEADLKFELTGTFSFQELLISRTIDTGTFGDFTMQV